MKTTLHTSSDLAAPRPNRLNYGQVQTRINQLVGEYLAIATLQSRLEDLPQQLLTPTPRAWQRIEWDAIATPQIVGIQPDIFIKILAGTIGTEAPIRGYTQASRQYLAHFYPAMARFVGGRLSDTGDLIELGLWEKEERRHTPALSRIYKQLTGQSPQVTPHSARPYSPSADLKKDLYRHGLHRIATEYGATCLYLWMMAHTTGTLQSVLAELLIDEINHMTKFWGFGLWAYPDSSFFKIGQTLFSALQEKWRNPHIQGSLLHTLGRMTQELKWAEWSFTNQASLMYTFGRVMYQLLQWHSRLTPEYLRALLGEPGGKYKAQTIHPPIAVKLS
ncbi:MAG: ferritin-like domain-containing protein [Cyanobacteria bacterium P01_A01_bin.114]